MIIKCRECGEELSVTIILRDIHSGHMITCPNCGHKIIIAAGNAVGPSETK